MKELPGCKPKIEILSRIHFSDILLIIVLCDFLFSTKSQKPADGQHTDIWKHKIITYENLN
jgi:hypothetical protein